jgi:Tfp pilus assembly pilus retraction ATPase PilT
MNFDEKYKSQKNKIPGKIPEGFFEKFEKELIHSLESKKAQNQNRRILWPIYASAAAAVALVIWYVLKPDVQQFENNIPQLVNESIHQDHGMNDITQNVLEKKDTVLNKKINPAPKAVQDTIITEEDILEFLLDEGYDET